MAKNIPVLLIGAGLLALTAGAAAAHDYDDNLYNHIGRDRQRLYQDGAKVREEQAELEAAHRRLRWAWWRGDYWAAKKAEHDVREERAEVAQARHKYVEQAEDIREDRARAYHHRRHWWRYWN